MNAIFTNWKTTLLGLIPLIIGILEITGMLSSTQGGIIGDGAIDIVNHVDGIVATVAGIIGVLARDADKSSEESGVK